MVLEISAPRGDFKLVRLSVCGLRADFSVHPAEFLSPEHQNPNSKMKRLFVAVRNLTVLAVELFILGHMVKLFWAILFR